MEIGTKMEKWPWKFRVIWVILNGLLYVGILLLIDYFFVDEPYTVSNLIFQGVSFGLFMGLGFPYIIEKFGDKFVGKVGKNNVPQMNDGEIIEIEGPANLLLGMEAIGGKLFLTNKKIIFKSHKVNIQRGQTEIHYEKVIELLKRKTRKLFDNGIRIKTNDGATFDFVVNERDKWMEELNARITECYKITSEIL